jgi:holo-[acyl-carrier protein] synthase
VIGVGIDAVDIERFRRVLARRPAIVDRLFTEGEKRDVGGRADPVPGMAARFAAKEAAWKALGVGLGATGLRDGEVVRTSAGAPALRVEHAARRLADELGVTSWLVSLTHTAMLAEAVVIAR